MTAPVVVVHVNGSSYPQIAQPAGAAPVEVSPASAEVPQADRTAPRVGSDPRQLQRDFDRIWHCYIRAAFVGPDAVANICLVHGCDEKTARNWLAGVGGCHGRHVIQAARTNPELAQTTLFSMAAE